jgi:hypothetical protein
MEPPNVNLDGNLYAIGIVDRIEGLFEQRIHSILSVHVKQQQHRAVHFMKLMAATI